MKNTIAYFFILVSFSMMILGCLTEKKAVKQLAKINHKFGELHAKDCGKRYPPVDSIWERETFIEGETMVVVDTVTVDCDSVLTNSVLTKIVKVPVKSSVRVDTVYKDRFQQVENTAMIEANRLTINKLENDAIELSHAKKIWMWIAIGLALFTVGKWVLKWGKSILSKLFTFVSF